MTAPEYVDVRVRIKATHYRALFAEAQRRRLDGAGSLLEEFVHRGFVLGRRPATPHRQLTADEVPEILRRIEVGEASVSSMAREYGVTRGAIQYYQRKARREAGDA